MEEIKNQNIRLKEITPHSWLMLNETSSNIGLVAENVRKEIVVLVQGSKVRFDNRNKANAYFGRDVFSDTIQIKSENHEHFVNGYSVRFEDPYEVDSDNDSGLPLCTKTKSGTVLYAAGYYVLHFPKSPVTAWCPKYSTLTKYGYEGPFKTELEAKAVHGQVKQRKPQ